METRTIRFCEFTGDGEHFWDEVGYKKKCQYVGIMDNCLTHRKPLSEFEGWRVCCEECTAPIQVKTGVFMTPINIMKHLEQQDEDRRKLTQ